MEILSSLGALSAVLRGAAGLVREFKRPRVSNDDFAEMLREEMRRANAVPADEARTRAQAERIHGATERFLLLRDVNGDGKLSIEESGLKEDTFAAFDADGDGAVSLAELRRPYLEALAGNDKGLA